jgi:NAD-dependent DNA ligase
MDSSVAVPPPGQRKTVKIPRSKLRLASAAAAAASPVKLNSPNATNNTTRRNRMNSPKTQATALTANPIPYLESKTPQQIADLLRTASDQYYKGTPIMTDDIFDIARNHLAERDPTNPVLKEIGAPTAAGDKIALPFWMGSLDKIREDEGALTKWKTKFPGKVVISDKLDGNSALLVYSSEGSNVKMYSRGDGHQGQNISHIIPHIQGIPAPSAGLAGTAVRGELIISKTNWTTKGKGANARNAVAGIMHSKNPDKALASIVEFVAYEQLSPKTTESKGLRALEAAGFHPVWNTKVATAELTMESLSALLMDRRANSPYVVDGIVIFHNGVHAQAAGKNPTYAFAFKSILTHEEAEVIVSEVEWNVSKDGYLKPLIYFPGVTLAGAKIQKATGFNAQFIEQNKIGPGSRIIIIRSGDVIPHIHKILSPAASGTPSLPDQTKTPWAWNETHVDAVLTNVAAAEDVIVKRMEYFAEKLEMKGVGEGVVKRMYAGGIDSIKKMLQAQEADLLKLDGFQAKSAAKVVKEIRDAVARADCLTFMHASNLFGRSLGSTKLKTIVSAFPKIIEGHVPTEAELATIGSIGGTTARQFLAGLPDFFAFMEDIGVPCASKAGVSVVKPLPPPPASAKSLVGQSIVFTGVRDKDLEAQIEARGGKVSTSVSGKTSVVVAKNPADTTGKVKSAIDLGIPVVDIETFRKNYL